MLENVVGRDDDDGVDLELAGCVVVDDHGLKTFSVSDLSIFSDWVDVENLLEENILLLCLNL